MILRPGIISCSKNALEVRRKAMETGCVNVFCLSLFLYATTRNPKLRFTKHFRSSQLPVLLVLLMLAFVPSFVLSADIDAPSERAGVGEKCMNGSFPRHD